PTGWVTPTGEEMSQVFGKGLDTKPPPPPPPPCCVPPPPPDTCCICKVGGLGGGGGGGGGGCTGCRWPPPRPSAAAHGSWTASGYGADDGLWYSHGVPVWNVLEPYISVQLQDIPVSYAPSRGADFAVGMYYSEHEDRTTNYFGFGPQWCSSLLSYIHMENLINADQPYFNEYHATVYGIGGGQLSFFYTSNYPDASTFTTFERLFTNSDGTMSGAAIHYPEGGTAVYGLRQL